MNETPPPAAPPEARFRHKLAIATYGLLFVVLVIHLLQEFATILRPLLIAVFIAYVLLPIHRWLVKRGVRSGLAFGVILSLLLLLFVGAGTAVSSGIRDITSQERGEFYKGKLAGWGTRLNRWMDSGGPEPVREQVRRVIGSIEVSTQTVIRDLDLFGVGQRVAGNFFGFLTFSLIVFVYLVFLVAEKVTFPRRMAMALGDEKAGHVLDVVGHINGAIVNYIAVKTWISFVTGLLSLVVFVAFKIDFAIVWAILIFLFNFIPYIGGLVAVAPPVALAFIQSETVWPGLAVVALIVGIQLFTGQYMEPKLAGRRLNLSPLLILLALAFWGYLWGPVGMILAVPLTVVCKIVLDAIPETKPLGTLMSNV